MRQRVRRFTLRSAELWWLRDDVHQHADVLPWHVHAVLRGRHAAVRRGVRRLGVGSIELRRLRSHLHRDGALRRWRLFPPLSSKPGRVWHDVRFARSRPAALWHLHYRLPAGLRVRAGSMYRGLPGSSRRVRRRSVCRPAQRSGELRWLRAALCPRHEHPAGLHHERVCRRALPPRVRRLQQHAAGRLRGQPRPGPRQLRRLQSTVQWHVLPGPVLPAASSRLVRGDLRELHRLWRSAELSVPGRRAGAAVDEHSAELSGHVRQLQRSAQMRHLLSLLVFTAACASPSSHTCTDGIANGQESDVDCGGPDCGACEGSKSCETHEDCVSLMCAKHVCAAGSCRDGKVSGKETDVDCGGGCAGCPAGKICALPGDCESGRCMGGACAAPTCSDRVTNGLESDVDCGGPCAPCPLGAACTRNLDCVTGGCINATCLLPTGACPLPAITCGPACVDPRVDPMNCGGCGMACGPGASCRGSTCVNACPSGTTSCGPACVNTAVDVLHCGSCGVMCQPGSRCVAGGCLPRCAPGQVDCFGECVSIATDNLHCGGCGMPCSPGAVCSMGQCGPSCAPPLMTCAGGASCADPRFDPNNCGGCGVVCSPAANATRLCLNMTCGRSACATGFADCNGLLSDGCEVSLATDTANCGRCRNVCTVGTCTSGTCP